MHWLTAILGAFLGAVLGSVGMWLPDGGTLLGAFLGWQWGRLWGLRRRVDVLERQLREQAAAQARSPQGAQQPIQRPVQAATSQTAQPATRPITPTAAPVPERAAPEVVMRDVPVQKPVDVSMPASQQPPPAPAAKAAAASARASTPASEAVTARWPREPVPPSLAERLLARAKGWLFTGNVPVKIGVLVLLFGVAAALKYSVDAGWVSMPLSVRLAMIAAGGLVAIVWGWRNRLARPAFGLSLQGGGIGVLLLTIFAAFRLYHLLPSGIAFALVLVLVAGAAALAVLQNTVALAWLGFLGAYLAPVLLSTKVGHPAALFSFYAVLNLAVFVIAWLRHWRALNLLGFFFTFGIGFSWGAGYYRPEYFATVAPFLLLFFLFYVGIAVLHTLRAPEEKRGFVDGTLVFGTPLLAFPMLVGMLGNNAMMLAFCALFVALLYAGLTFWLIRVRKLTLLGQSFGALAVGFATLAIPLAFSPRWTCVAWALEGVALAWLGLRQRRLLPQVAGISLYGLAMLAYGWTLLDRNWHARMNEWPVLNGHALCVVLLSVCGFALAWLYERAGKGRLQVWPGFLLGTLWWGWAGLREIEQFFGSISLEPPFIGTQLSWVMFAAITLLVMGGLRKLLAWPRLGWNVLLTLMLSLLLALVGTFSTNTALHWPLGAGWVFWVAAALLALACLREPQQKGIPVAHIAFFMTLAVCYGGALLHLAYQFKLGMSWMFVLSWLPLLGLFVLTLRWPWLGAFPLEDEFPAYEHFWFGLAGALSGLAWLQSLLLSGDMAPLPFISLLNPVELLQLLGLLFAAHWLWQRLPQQAAWLLAVPGFIFISNVGLRGLHHYAGLPWSPAILDSGVTQATLTVLWSIAGVLAWIAGSRRQLWQLWLVGAICMGLVLLKLLLVDRLYVGNLTGIVSLFAVGGLLVLVGRLAPTPPRHEALMPEDMSEETP